MLSLHATCGGDWRSARHPLPTTHHPREKETAMNDESGDFERFLRQREAAALAYVNGDPAALGRLAAPDDPATFFSPRGDVVQGAQRVAERYARDAAAFATDNQNALQILHAAAGETLAYWVGIQRSDVHLRGQAEAVPFRLRVTEIFRREGEAWKLVHRHADPLAPPDA
jgi:ketosteroid isomerase-like protein